MSSKNSHITTRKRHSFGVSVAMLFLLTVPVYLEGHPYGFGFGTVLDQAIGCLALVGGIYGLLSAIWIAKCATADDPA